MCVTLNLADMGGTLAYTYATTRDGESRPLHITGYQNAANNLGEDPNCMFLHFPGDEIRLVHEPEHTENFMFDMIRGLTPLGAISRSVGGFRVEEYGDYHVVLAEELSDIFDALAEVPEERRPKVTEKLEKLVGWYGWHFAGHSFVLACFEGKANPKHPIVVEYHPHNDDVLTVPGVDAHDGNLPSLRVQTRRDFRIAFGADGLNLDIKPDYTDAIIDSDYWAPKSVTGFYDNRWRGPNDDYVIALSTLNDGFRGAELAEHLIYNL